MEQTYVRYLNLPHRIKGLAIQDDEGNYNIYLNSRLNNETNIKTLKHEIEHIENGDFSSLFHINKLEN